MITAVNSRGMPNIMAITTMSRRTKNNVATMLPVSVLVPDSMMRPITSVWFINIQLIFLFSAPQKGYQDQKADKIPKGSYRDYKLSGEAHTL